MIEQIGEGSIAQDNRHQSLAHQLSQPQNQKDDSDSMTTSYAQTQKKHYELRVSQQKFVQFGQLLEKYKNGKTVMFDHSLMLQQIITLPYKITFFKKPMGFGNRTNISMLNYLLSHHHDTNCNCQQKSGATIKNIQLLKISNNSQIMQKDIGRYGSIYVDLHKLNLSNEKEYQYSFAEFCLQIASRYKYLQNQQKFSKFISFVEQFIDKYKNDKTLQSSETKEEISVIEQTFATIAKCTQTHLGNKYPCLMFVNGWDVFQTKTTNWSPENRKLIENKITNMILVYVRSFGNKIFDSSIDKRKVFGSCVINQMLTESNPKQYSYTFSLFNHKFSQYFGVSYEEIKKLMQSFGFKEDDIQQQLLELMGNFGFYNNEKTSFKDAKTTTKMNLNCVVRVLNNLKRGVSSHSVSIPVEIDFLSAILKKDCINFEMLYNIIENNVNGDISYTQIQATQKQMSKSATKSIRKQIMAPVLLSNYGLLIFRELKGKVRLYCPNKSAKAHLKRIFCTQWLREMGFQFDLGAFNIENTTQTIKKYLQILNTMAKYLDSKKESFLHIVLYCRYALNRGQSHKIFTESTTKNRGRIDHLFVPTQRPGYAVVHELKFRNQLPKTDVGIESIYEEAFEQIVCGNYILMAIKQTKESLFKGVIVRAILGICQNCESQSQNQDDDKQYALQYKQIVLNQRQSLNIRNLMGSQGFVESENLTKPERASNLKNKINIKSWHDFIHEIKDVDQNDIERFIEQRQFTTTRKIRSNAQ